VSREAMDEMMLHEWPGNVRELENAIERAVVVGKGRRVTLDDLPICRRGVETTGVDHSLQEVERSHIVHVLGESGWNIKKSAEILGIDRSTLYAKLKRHNIRKPV